jgi:hypothetical protein
VAAIADAMDVGGRNSIPRDDTVDESASQREGGMVWLRAGPYCRSPVIVDRLRGQVHVVPA